MRSQCNLTIVCTGLSRPQERAFELQENIEGYINNESEIIHFDQVEAKK